MSKSIDIISRSGGGRVRRTTRYVKYIKTCARQLCPKYQCDFALFPVFLMVWCRATTKRISKKNPHNHRSRSGVENDPPLTPTFLVRTVDDRTAKFEGMEWELMMLSLMGRDRNEDVVYFWTAHAGLQRRRARQILLSQQNLVPYSMTRNDLKCHTSCGSCPTLCKV
jgi:hypothetical protein